MISLLGSIIFAMVFQLDSNCYCFIHGKFKLKCKHFPAFHDCLFTIYGFEQPCLCPFVMVLSVARLLIWSASDAIKGRFLSHAEWDGFLFNLSTGKLC